MNEFQALRQNGIAGHLYDTQDVNTETIWHKGDNIVSIRTAEVKEGVVLLGWKIITEPVKSDQQVWEGAGWFKTEDRAQLWFFGELLSRQWVNEEQTPGLYDELIRRCRNLSCMSMF